MLKDLLAGVLILLSALYSHFYIFETSFVVWSLTSYWNEYEKRDLISISGLCIWNIMRAGQRIGIIERAWIYKSSRRIRILMDRILLTKWLVQVYVDFAIDTVFVAIAEIL